MKKRYAFLFALMAFTLFIFMRSLKNAEDSSDESRLIVRIIVDIIERFNENPPANIREIVTVIVRKCAHVAEYAVHSILAFGLFSTFEGAIRRFLPSMMFLGLFTACVDEAIQLTSAGRAGMVEDVFIDFGGTLVGICICMLVGSIYNRRKKLNNNSMN